MIFHIASSFLLLFRTYISYIFTTVYPPVFISDMMNWYNCLTGNNSKQLFNSIYCERLSGDLIFLEYAWKKTVLMYFVSTHIDQNCGMWNLFCGRSIWIELFIGNSKNLILLYGQCNIKLTDWLKQWQQCHDRNM